MTTPHQHISRFEHERLRVGENDKGTTFTASHLSALERFYGSGVPYFKLIHRGVQFCEYVGVLQVGDLQIEILPKADKQSSESHWRKLLIDMLRTVGSLNIHAPSSSALRLKSSSILDLYVELFIQEVEYLLHRGLAKQYRKATANCKSLKGALQFGGHITKNLVHQERFYVRFTTYDEQHLLHQVLGETLLLLKRINRNPVLHSRISVLLLSFPQLPRLQVHAHTFDRIHLNRKTKSYQKALEISKLLLLNFHPDVQQGKQDVLAIMFDMNQLWERFIYHCLQRTKRKDMQVFPQRSRLFWQSSIKQSFLQPDIVIRTPQGQFVLDTKWKNLQNLKPSVDDLRQLYAYHRYFGAHHVALVYPGSHPLIKGNYAAEGFAPVEQEDQQPSCTLISIPAGEDMNSWQRSIEDIILGEWLELDK